MLHKPRLCYPLPILHPGLGTVCIYLDRSQNTAEVLFCTITVVIFKKGLKCVQDSSNKFASLCCFCKLTVKNWEYVWLLFENQTDKDPN